MSRSCLGRPWEVGATSDKFGQHVQVRSCASCTYVNYVWEGSLGGYMARILKTRLQFAKLKKKSGESEPTYGNEIQMETDQE